MRNKDDVEKLIHALFAPEHHAHVREQIDRYGENANVEPERYRVQFAVLMLTEGDLTQLEKYLVDAKRDYRDVLYWFEYPQESRIDTPEKRQEVRALFSKLGLEIPRGLKD